MSKRHSLVVGEQGISDEGTRSLASLKNHHSLIVNDEMIHPLSVKSLLNDPPYQFRTPEIDY